MRFVSALLCVALTGSVALAEEAKPADPKPEVTKRKVPLRVVKMLPETRQVLLFDKDKGTHVVAEVGQAVDGYVVDEIDDDEVSLVSDSGAQVILTAPEHGHAKAAKAAKAARKAKASAGKPATDPAPVDPYADPADATTAPAPTVAGENGVRVADAGGADAAPVDPYANLDPGVAAFVKAVGADPAPDTAAAADTAAAPATAAPAKAPAKASAKASSDGAALGAAFGGTPAGDVAPATDTPAAPTPAPATVTPGPTTASLSRAEVNAAIGDFAATASTFRATFTGQGLRFDDVHAGSLLAKIGLQKGDIVTTVDGQPLRSLDDAANLYVRLPTAHGTTISVLRAGKPVTLRVAIQ